MSLLLFRDARSSHTLGQHKKDTEGHKITGLDIENRPTKIGLICPSGWDCPGAGIAPGVVLPLAGMRLGLLCILVSRALPGGEREEYRWQLIVA